MKKTALLCLLALLLGCGSGFVLGQQSGGGGASPPAGGAEMSISPLSPSVDQEAPAPEDNTALLEAGSTVLQALRDGISRPSPASSTRSVGSPSPPIPLWTPYPT